MSLSFQPDADLNYFDGLESVSVRAAAGAAAVPVAGALRRRIETHEAEVSGGRYFASDVDWHLPAAELGAQPAIGSLVTDSSGIEYRVLRVERATLASRWVCRSRSLAITGDLDRLITLERATWTKDSSGAAVATWSVVRSDLAARIQPQAGTIGVEQDRRLTRVTHRVYLAEDVAIDHNDRVVAGEVIYRVLGFEQTARIDVLCCLLVERVDGALGFFGDSSGDSSS